MMTRREALLAGGACVWLKPSSKYPRIAGGVSVRLPEKTEFTLGMRATEFPAAFADTPESAAEFHRLMEEMRRHIIWVVKQRQLTDLDAVTIEFNGVPLA